MKKTLLLLASAAMLLVGCAKEKFSPEAGDVEMVNMTVSALVQGEEATKAAIDEDGKGVNANRCIMVLYYGDQVYGRYQAAVSEYHATFDVKVPAKRTYKAVFWADCATDNGDGTFTDVYYDTDDLANITLKSDYVGNDDKRDAFFKCEEYTVENKSQSFTAELTRPFAQINVISKDIKDLHLAALYPQKVNLSFSAATSFNAMSGECGAAEAIAYEADVYKAYDPAKTQLTLSMDYLFAGDRSAVDIDFKAPTEGTLKVEHNFSNIPYQRNYRTNIVGNLLTADAHWDVTINPEWNQLDEDVKFVEAGSVEAANEAFENGAISVKITSVGDETTLYLPQTTKDVTIDFADPSETITVKYGPDQTKAAGEKPATVNIATNDITKFVVTGISNIVWLAGNQAALANALTNATNKQVVALSNDITMSGEWVPVTSKNGGGYYIGTFDGRNHTISNLKITDYTGTYIGFFSTVSGATIKNVTFKDAELTNAESLGGNARGAVIVGWSYACNIDNCHVINSSVTGCQKVAGILGSMSVEGSAGLNSVTNCSVEGLTISCNIENDLFQSGALVGYIQLINTNPDGILIENNSVKDITFNDDCSDYGNISYYNGTFIGTIDRKQKVADQKIILKNNIISGTNTELFKTVYSSIYFGWTTNPESYTGAIAPIIIDGQEWTPNYPVKIVGGKGYATLAEALAAATEGQTVQILKAGDYTVQTLSTKAAVVEATVEGVVFNHTAGYKSWVSAEDGHVKTVKNITWNVGEANYQYFNNTNLENCTVNGQLCTHGSNKFKDCTFINEEGYNFWVYGNVYTEFDNCTFTCPGKNDGVAGCGSALNCYNERDQTPTPVLVVKNCTFTAKEASNKYSAIYIKDKPAFDIRITNSTCNDKFCTGAISGSKLWNLKSDRDGTTVSIDGTQVYPFYSQDANGNFHVANAKGLLSIAKDMNKSLDKFYYKTIFLDADIDLADAAWTPIVGGTSGDFDFDFDGQNHEIKNVAIDANGSKNAAFIGNWAGDIKNLTINTITVTNGDKRAAGLVGQMATGTIENCHVINANIKSSNYKVGGLVGSVTADPCTIKNCSVKNSSIEGLEQVGGFCGSLGTGDGGATKFIDNVVENITINSCDAASAKANTFGAYVGTYYADGYVAENTNNAISGTNNIFSANEGFGILLAQ